MPQAASGRPQVIGSDRAERDLRRDPDTVTTDPNSSRSQTPKDIPPASASRPPMPEDRSPRMTRISAAWVATAAALLLLVMLIVFILQNTARVEVHYLGLAGSLPLGMALLIAAVGGGVVVAIAGIARVTQLRMKARRTRQHNSGA
jgi:uncharacterized integral membrane protein